MSIIHPVKHIFYSSSVLLTCCLVLVACFVLPGVAIANEELAEVRLYKVTMYKGGEQQRAFLAELIQADGYHIYTSPAANPLEVTGTLSENDPVRIIWKKSNGVRVYWEGVFNKIPNGYIFSNNRYSYVVEGHISKELPIADEILPPFKDVTPGFADLKRRLVDVFGAYRSSHKKGHKHAGVDLGGDWGEPVYSIAKGEVLFRSYWRHNAIVVVGHEHPELGYFYSKYVHLENIAAEPGDLVTSDSVLGYLFQEDAFDSSGYKELHLHLEIRKDYSDFGRASSHSMSLKDLHKCCYAPMEFFNKWLSP